MNQIMLIKPYFFEGMETWAFDDWDVELMHEPFVEGIPEMIDDFVKDIPNAKKGFKLLFSGSPFPGYQRVLEKLRPEFDGCWYRDPSNGLEGWLCPAMFRYFKVAPDKIYLKAEKLK